MDAIMLLLVFCYFIHVRIVLYCCINFIDYNCVIYNHIIVNNTSKFKQFTHYHHTYIKFRLTVRVEGYRATVRVTVRARVRARVRVRVRLRVRG